MRLQSKLLLVLLPLAVAPLLVLGFVAYEQLRTTAEQRSLDQLETLLDQLSNNVRARLHTLEANVKLLAGATLVKRYVLTEDEEERYALLAPPLLKFFQFHLDAYPDYFEIRVLLPDGYEDARATREPLRNASEEEADSEWFRLLADLDEGALLHLFRNEDDGRFSLLAGVPLRLVDLSVDPFLSEPKLRGYLAVTMSLDFLAEQARTSRVGQTGFIFFANQAGRVLFHPDPAQIGTIVPAEFWQKHRQSVSDGEAAPGVYRGKALIMGIREIGAGLYVLGVLPESELLAAGRRLGVVVAGTVFLTTLAIAVLLIASLRRLVVTPLDELRKASREIGRGDHEPSLLIRSNDELGELAIAFTEMGRNLERSAKQIRYLAYHDSLTGLPNRLLLGEFLGHLMAHARRSHEAIAVLFLDLDNFKRVNDTLGHPVGDELLKKVAGRLIESLRGGDLVARDGPGEKADMMARKGPNQMVDLVARVGGDEFLILLPDLSRSEAAGKVARRVLATINQPYSIGGHELYVTGSLGIALYPQDGADVEELVQRADIAMFQAKQQGRDNFQFYSEALNRASIERLSLEGKLRKAVEEQELEIHYQPQVDALTGRIVGAEALLRWTDPELGVVSPGRFIAVAEEAGLILPLGEWVLLEACRRSRHWQQCGLPPLVLSVNVSPIQFQRQEFQRVVARTLEASGLDPRYLEIEITESTLATAASGAVEKLDAIKALGAGISLDDFGTGYSSLSYLRQFPIDKLKIDRSFVKEVESDPDDGAIVTAILAMAKALKLATVAEGVETLGQLEHVRAGGCELIQGYLYSRPVPESELLALLETGYIEPAP